MFTFTISFRPAATHPFAVVFDKGIAPAVSEEKNTADGCVAAGRKLIVKVNMAGLLILPVSNAGKKSSLNLMKNLWYILVLLQTYL